MFATEAGGDGSFFEGVVDCVAMEAVRGRWLRQGDNGAHLRRAEELLEHDVHASHHLG